MTKKQQAYSLQHEIGKALCRSGSLLLAGFISLMSVVFGVSSPVFAQTGLAPAEDPQKGRIVLEARMTEVMPTIEDGLEWRIFTTRIGDGGQLDMLAQATGGTKAFDITLGEYLIHVAYGHASAVRRITVDPGAKTEAFILNAGGLQLDAVAAIDTRIQPQLLRFDVFSDEVDAATGQRRLIAPRVLANQIVPFPTGTYHVVSKFGNLNAEVRADLRVQPGKVTQATLQHRAARITFRLVSIAGGDAIADTAWSILTEGGEVISESNSAFPSMVLAEGNYSAIAKNRETIYSRNFEVRSGFNTDVEVIAENAN